MAMLLAEDVIEEEEAKADCYLHLLLLRVTIILPQQFQVKSCRIILYHELGELAQSDFYLHHLSHHLELSTDITVI